MHVEHNNLPTKQHIKLHCYALFAQNDRTNSTTVTTERRFDKYRCFGVEEPLYASNDSVLFLHFYARAFLLDSLNST